MRIAKQRRRGESEGRRNLLAIHVPSVSLDRLVVVVIPQTKCRIES